MRMLFGALLLLAGNAHALVIQPFISEIHYDNIGPDEHEFVEITGAGVDLSGWLLRFYNGANGEIYGSIDLTGILSVTQLQATAFYPGFPIQNGPADGVALVNDDGRVADFIAYEGELVAQEGEADGLVARVLPVSESSRSPVGRSLQRDHLHDPDSWRVADATPGQLNPGLVPAPPGVGLLLLGLALMLRARTSV